MGSPQMGSFLWTVRLVSINVLVFAGIYGLLELSYSTYAYFFRDASPYSYLVIEHPGETVHFDLDRGLFLTKTPSRMALAEQNSFPIVVVHIPFPKELLNPYYPSRVDRTRRFAEILGSTFVDGREVFHGLTKEQVTKLWYSYDGHWNPLGSSRFAEYIANRIPNWVASNKSHSATFGGNPENPHEVSLARLSSHKQQQSR